MKISQKNYTYLITACLFAFAVYGLLDNGIIKVSGTVFFLVVTAVSAALLVGYLISVPIVESRRIRQSCCQYGNMAVLGGCGAILLSLLAGLIRFPYGTGYHLAVAAVFFFLALLLSGLSAFLYHCTDCGCCMCEESTCGGEDSRPCCELGD